MNPPTNPRPWYAKAASATIRNRAEISSRFDHCEGVGFAPEGAEVHSQGRQPLGKRKPFKNPAPAGRRFIAGEPQSIQGRKPPLAINRNPSGV
jgi:hypothetical protein